MGKQERPEGLKTSVTDTESERPRERGRQQALETARKAMAREGKDKLVEVLKEWLRE